MLGQKGWESLPEAERCLLWTVEVYALLVVLKKHATKILTSRYIDIHLATDFFGSRTHQRCSSSQISGVLGQLVTDFSD